MANEERKPEAVVGDTNDAIREQILKGTSKKLLDAAIKSGDMSLLTQPHQKDLIDTYFKGDGVQYARSISDIFKQYSHPTPEGKTWEDLTEEQQTRATEKGYDALRKLHAKFND